MFRDQPLTLRREARYCCGTFRTSCRRDDDCRAGVEDTASIPESFFSVHIHATRLLRTNCVHLKQRALGSGSDDSVMSLCHSRYVGRKGKSRYPAFDAAVRYQSYRCSTCPDNGRKCNPSGQDRRDSSKICGVVSPGMYNACILSFHP